MCYNIVFQKEFISIPQIILWDYQLLVDPNLPGVSNYVMLLGLIVARLLLEAMIYIAGNLNMLFDRVCACCGKALNSKVALNTRV